MKVALEFTCPNTVWVGFLLFSFSPLRKSEKMSKTGKIFAVT